MPRFKRPLTLTSRILAELDKGKKPPEIARKFDVDVSYVQVVRSRARRAAAGIKRNRLAERAPRQGRTHDPEKRKAQKKRARLALEKRRWRPLRRIADQYRAEEQQRKMEEDLAVASSIAARRAHVDRILAAWRQADGEAKAPS